MIEIAAYDLKPDWARVAEHLFDQTIQSLRPLDDSVEFFYFSRVRPDFPFEKGGKAENPSQRIADLMRHKGRHLAKLLHPVMEMRPRLQLANLRNVSQDQNDPLPAF